MFDFLKHLISHGRYKTPQNAVVIACFYNPENSPYRLLAFQKFYRTIKHLPHRVVECTMGDAKPQLPDSTFISRVQTDSLLWHKEALLNKLVRGLPDEFDYIFWVDADILFTNDQWLHDAVDVLQTKQVVHPFEYGVHLDRNQIVPSFDVDAMRVTVSDPFRRHPSLWRSFAANYCTTDFSADANYDRHGHVGFVWGARRSLLERVPLYDRALIGGADHIMAHAAAGQIIHPCIARSFTDDLDAIREWSVKFHAEVNGDIGYCEGDVYHLWHGEVQKRRYLKRIQDFTPVAKQITQRDPNGLYVSGGRSQRYMRNYYQQRETPVTMVDDFNGYDDDFAADMGYAIAEIATMFGQPNYPQQPPDDSQSFAPAAAPDPDTTPVEASYQPAPDPDTTPVETSYSSPDPDTAPVEASYSTPDPDNTPVEGNFS